MNEILWTSRWSRDQVKTMLVEQFESFWQRDTGIPRDKLADLQKAESVPHAVIVSGLRRAGKSTLLAQLAHQMGQEAFYYLNFEDDRFLGLQVEDTSNLYQILVEIYGERKIFIVDEIQNLPGWEHFVRRFIDMGFKFFITGSNASLLSQELGTRLTGRYIPIELFPFSFREFLRFRGQDPADLRRITTAGKGKLNAALGEYLRLGGIPDALKYPDLPLLRTLYDDVLYRDIAARYHLEGVTALKELAFLLMSNPASLVNYNKLKQQFRLGSVNTIKNYIEYLGNSWLVFSLNLYDYSVKRQQVSPKKIYCIDSGLSTAVGFAFSANTGKFLENLVFLTLRQRHRDIYYFHTQDGHEVDFYLPEEGLLIQVAQDLGLASTRERELRSLSEAVGMLKVKEALVLADENEEGIKAGKVPVKMRSTAEWLLEN